MESFSEEALNFFKFSVIVLYEFPVILRQVFVLMWDSLVASTPGFQNWDDSPTVRNMFLAKEGGKIDYVPTDKSYLEWDCTALFQATLFSETFALPDGYGKRCTLHQLYVKPLPTGTFHDRVLSLTGNTAETHALALDQLRLLRNTLCHSSNMQKIDKTTFDHYLMLARDAFMALEQKSIGIDSTEELSEDSFPNAKIQQLKRGLEKENSIAIEFQRVNNHLKAIKSQDGIQFESDKWQCSHLTFHLRNVINGIASVKRDEQNEKRKKDLKLLLSCLQEELEMNVLENLNAKGQSVVCIICKEWIFGRAVFFILTDKGVKSDCVDAASGSGNSRDPDVFLFSPASDPKKKSPFVVLWKTPSVLEMKELSHVGCTLRESIHMLFLQPQFQKNCVVGQDFYMEVSLPTYATSSLYTQIDYLPVLVELELSESNKDRSNIDSIVNSPSVHVSYFSYRFSNQRQAEFVFDNLIPSLGKLSILTEVQDAVISPLHNVAIFFFLEAKFSNSSLSVVVEKDSVIMKCRSICEFESTCICLLVRNTLESRMESLSHFFRISLKSFHLQLCCEEADVSHYCKYETGSACACARRSDPEYVLEGEQGTSLPQNKDETNIQHADHDLEDATVDGPLWYIVGYTGLEREYTKSDLQASVGDEVPSANSAHCDASKQLDTSLLSVCSNSSLNSCLISPCDPAQEAPDFNEHFSENSSMASVDCSASNLALEENSSQFSFGVNDLQDCSVMRSSFEEGLRSVSEKDFFDTKTSKVEPLEDTVEETREEHKCGLQGVNSSYNTASGELPCTAPHGTRDPSSLTVLPENKEGTVAMLHVISQLQSEIAFYQHQCDEERQRSSELKEKLKQTEEEKQQLEVEVGRHQFIECKEKRGEKILQSSVMLVSEQSKSCTASGGSSAFTRTAEKLIGGSGTLQESSFALLQILLEISNSLSETELKQLKFLVKPKVTAFQLAKIREGFELFEELDTNGVLSCSYVRDLLRGIQRFDLVEKLDVPLVTNAEIEQPEEEPSADGTFCMELGPEQEPRSHPPTGQTMLDGTTQSSFIPQRDHNLDLLPEKPSQMCGGDNMLQLQSSYEEGLATAGQDPITEARETDTLESRHMQQSCHPTDGEFRDGVDSLHQNNNPKSDSKRKRMFLSAKNDDDVARLITTAAERDNQEQIERLQRELQEYEAENQVLREELKRTSLPVDIHVGSENIFQLSREYSAGVASCVKKDLPGGANPLPGARSCPPTGQTMADRITESSIIPPRDQDLLFVRHDDGCDETLDGMHIQGNGGSEIIKAGPVSNMSCRDSVICGSDMVVLPMNSSSQDSSAYPGFPDASCGVSFSNESFSTTASLSESSVSSVAEPMRVESTSSSCMAHSVCDGKPRVSFGHLSAVKNHEHFSDTCSINPTSGEEDILESTFSSECESGDVERREEFAKNEETGEVSESSGDVSDGPGKPHHLKMKSAAGVAKDVVDCGPLHSPDRARVKTRSQHVPGLMQDALPDGDISVKQNVSGTFSGTGKDTTVDQLVSDVSTQSKQWARFGARPRDKPPVKMTPTPEPSLIGLVPQEVKVASGLANAFLARHSQDQSLHESLCQGSAVKLISDETSLQGASYMDGTKHVSEGNKAKPYLGDCQVGSRPDVDIRWMFPPPVPGGEFDSCNAVGGYPYNTQLNSPVGPLSSYLTGGTSNFPSSNVFNSSNYNSFRSDFALGTREPYLPLCGQLDSGLNTSVPRNQCLHSGMTGSHLANGLLTGTAGPQLTPPVHGLQRYSGPSDNASTIASERESTQLVWNANSRLTSIGNTAGVGSSGLPALLADTRSNGAVDRHVLETEISRTNQYTVGTGGSNELNTSGDRIVASANRDIDDTHTQAALLSGESRGSRLVASANGDSNLEPRGAEVSLLSANTGSSMLNRDFGTDSVESTDNSLLALEQRVEEACALVERVLREREEREQFGREIERKEREIREQRARKKREREAREQEEASRWPQQQEAITGRSQWFCEHYQRHCRVRFPCCTHFYPCHRCHNNSKACDNEEAKASHATHLKCSFCQHEQEIGEDSGKCRSCGAQMSAYFCSICKHFTSVDKNPYHCEKCGICRIHKDKSFHCEVCNVCLDKRLEGKHKCRADSGHDECCICLEDAFSGCQILPCSHKVHRECAIAMIQNGIRTCPVCRHPLYSSASE